jgi:hypothetical protein
MRWAPCRSTSKAASPYPVLVDKSFLISVFFQKILTISNKGIRYVFKWELEWDDIDKYDLNTETGTLSIHVKDENDDKQIAGISKKYYSTILTNMNNCLVLASS